MNSMDFDAYRKAFFADPLPEPRYQFTGSFSVALYFEEYEDAVAYYEAVLGPPGYIEGESTRGWQIGAGWLTLLRGKSGSPTNVEVAFELETPDEAEALQNAFLAAGGRGQAPSNQLMYKPIRSCPVADPFGTEILVIAPLSEEGD